MIKPKRFLSACLLWPLLTPIPASALVVEIQGVRLEPINALASCVEIAGAYAGVKIETSESGKVPRICYNSEKINTISILHASFIATSPINKDIVIKFEHRFPPGINGKIMARSKLQGFFSTPDGIGVPVGDKISLDAFFLQHDHTDAIAEPFNVTVGDDIDSAMFELSNKEQYLISGPRALRGVLRILFTSTGHKLTIAEKSSVSIDTGSTRADKLDLVEPLLDQQLENDDKKPAPLPTAPAAPAPGQGAKKAPPVAAPPPQPPQQPIPFPSPGDGGTGPLP